MERRGRSAQSSASRKLIYILHSPRGQIAWGGGLVLGDKKTSVFMHKAQACIEYVNSVSVVLTFHSKEVTIGKNYI